MALKLTQHTVRLSLIFICSQVLTAQTPCAAPELDKRIEISSSEGGNVVERLFQIGKETGVCFGLDIRHKAILNKEFRTEKKRTTLRKLLTELTDSAVYSEKSGVIVVSFGEGSNDWLDEIIPRFQVGNVPIELASGSLFEHLLALFNPGGGVVSSISSSIGSPSVRPFSAEHIAVKDALTRILAESAAGGIWFTAGPHPVQQPPVQGMWTVLFYGDRLTFNQSRIQDMTKP